MWKVGPPPGLNVAPFTPHLPRLKTRGRRRRAPGGSGQARPGGLAGSAGAWLRRRSRCSTATGRSGSRPRVPFGELSVESRPAVSVARSAVSVVRAASWASARRSADDRLLTAAVTESAFVSASPRTTPEVATTSLPTTTERSSTLRPTRSETDEGVRGGGLQRVQRPVDAALLLGHERGRGLGQDPELGPARPRCRRPELVRMRSSVVNVLTAPMSAVSARAVSELDSPAIRSKRSGVDEATSVSPPARGPPRAGAQRRRDLDVDLAQRRDARGLDRRPARDLDVAVDGEGHEHLARARRQPYAADVADADAIEPHDGARREPLGVLEHDHDLVAGPEQRLPPTGTGRRGR